MPYGLRKNIIEKMDTVFAKYPQIEKVILYGSRAKGCFQNGSDIDLTHRRRDRPFVITQN